MNDIISAIFGNQYKITIVDNGRKRSNALSFAIQNCTSNIDPTTR
jgi:hypothetical protein